MRERLISLRSFKQPGVADRGTAGAMMLAGKPVKNEGTGPRDKHEEQEYG